MVDWPILAFCYKKRKKLATLFLFSPRLKKKYFSLYLLDTVYNYINTTTSKNKSYWLLILVAPIMNILDKVHLYNYYTYIHTVKVNVNCGLWCIDTGAILFFFFLYKMCTCILRIILIS